MLAVLLNPELTFLDLWWALQAYNPLAALLIEVMVRDDGWSGSSFSFLYQVTLQSELPELPTSQLNFTSSLLNTSNQGDSSFREGVGGSENMQRNLIKMAHYNRRL